MVQLFKSSSVALYLLLFVYALLLQLPLVVLPPVLSLDGGAPLYHLISLVLRYLRSIDARLLPIFFVACLTVQAYLLNMVASRLQLFDTPNTWVAFCYVLLCSLFAPYLYLSAPFFSLFALLPAIGITANTPERGGYLPAFDAGMWVGIAALCYPATSVMLVFVWISLLINRFFNWRESVLMLWGFLLPYFMVGTVYFLLDCLMSPSILYHGSTITWYSSSYSLFELFIKLPLLLLLLLTAIGVFQARYFKSSVATRRSLTMLIYLLSISLTLFLLLGSRFSLAPLAIPLSALAALLAYSLHEIKRPLLSEIIHLLLVGTLLFFQYFSQYSPI